MHDGHVIASRRTQSGGGTLVQRGGFAITRGRRRGTLPQALSERSKGEEGDIIKTEMGEAGEKTQRTRGKGERAVFKKNKKIKKMLACLTFTLFTHLETAPGHAPAVPPNYNFILWAPKITALLCFHFVTTSKPKPPSKTRTLIPKP